MPEADTQAYARLGGARLQYEVDDRPITVRMDPGFAGQLAAWFTAWCELSGTTPDLVGTYGAWLADDGCRSPAAGTPPPGGPWTACSGRWG